MDKVLVGKAIEPNYNTLSGGPQFVVGGGGNDKGRGVTLRERAGGALGNLVGVLGAFASPHRSVGSLAQSMISGGAQGKALGRALGRKFVGRRAQARADMDAATRQRYADLGARGELDRFQFTQRRPKGMREQIAVIDAERARQEQAAKEAQARARAQAAAEGTQFGQENRENAKAFQDFTDTLVASGIPENEINERLNAFKAAVRGQGGGGAVRVDPSPPSQVLVRDASGMPVGNAQQMAGQALQLPVPVGGAGTEINDIERAGNQEAIKEGTDHTGNYGGRLALPAPQEEEEEENEMGTVGVVDSMRPTTLEQIQRQRQQEAQGGN